MKRILLALAAASLLALTLLPTLQAQTAPAKRWAVEDIFRNPGGPSGQPPHDAVWSPDSRLLTYVSPDAQTGEAGDIIQVAAATGKVSVLASKSRISALGSSGNLSEQDKDHRLRYNMSSYIWAADSHHLLLDSGGQLWYYSIGTGTGIQIASTGLGSGDDPKFSPNGKSVSYVRDHNLYVHPLGGGPEIPLTATHTDSLLNGEVDWVYLEELETRSNYFWSPDSAHLAYLQMNEEAVPEYPITDWIPTHASVERQRYPQPGDNNPDVRVGVVGAEGGKNIWLKIPLSARNDYIPRFGWIDKKTVYVEVLKRDHKHLEMYFADIATGQAVKVFTDDDPKFLDTNYDATFLSTGQLLWTSWRDGHAHIYLYGFNHNDPLANETALIRQLTKGDFEVSSIAGVDENKQTVYYVSNEGDPRQQNLWSIQLSGQGKRRLTTAAGVHDVVVSPDGQHFSDSAASQMVPPVASMCDTSGDCNAFWKSKALTGYSLIAPANLELKAKDGTTTLYGSLLLPQGTAGTASVPLIVNPYGGTHAQTVRNGWGSTSFLFDQLLAQHGFAVLHVDNRGMGARGRDFEQAAYHNFGPVQFEDQIAALDQVLAQYPQLDAKRLGWWGWSWGGSFTLYAMTHTDRFKAGISVAPVTDWKNYDSIYTERYLGQPSENPDGYKEDSVITSAAKLKGHLLLAHGTGDDNVHLANDVQMIQAFIDADIPYDYQIYPRKTHSIAGPEARTHLFNRMVTHWETYLKPTQ